MLKEGYEKVIRIPFEYTSPCRTDDNPAFRQDQAYSKLPIFVDGWYCLPGLS